MRAYERFVNYVKYHTTSTELSGTHPSFEGEFALAGRLADELKNIGLENAFVDGHCYVYASLPATEGMEGKPALGFIAHMDTSDEASGENVVPVFHENFNGENLKLPGSGVVMEAKQFPFLKRFAGETVISSDGTTLLGADDKAGIAEIMTALERLITEKKPHGKLFIAFTPDEEIGEGTDFFDMNVFKAEFAYTVDGGDIDCIEYENFNAASAKVNIKGVSVHPGEAKNVMVNALNVAHEFHALLPENERPEHTEGREGFFHLLEMGGRISEAHLNYIVRDHDKAAFERKKKYMRKAAAYLNEKYGEGTLELTIEDSYYNMLEKIKPHMFLVENAREAIKSVGLVPKDVPIRGGTDGARLSYDGIPCPNLGTGGYNFHGNMECITVERMDKAVEIILYLIESYYSQSGDDERWNEA